MQHYKFLTCGVSALLIGLLTDVSEASFAKRLGGKLSSNTSIATQQVTADPDPFLQAGSISVTYENQFVTFLSMVASTTNSPVFDLTDSYIGVDFLNTPNEGEVIITTQAFFSPVTLAVNGPYVETGYVQGKFERIINGNSVIPPANGYVIVDAQGNVTGDDAFAVFFDYRDETPLNTVVSYTIFLSPSRGVEEQPDFLLYSDGDVLKNPEDEVESATVSGAIPEPATLGLLAFAGLALLRRR